MSLNIGFQEIIWKKTNPTPQNSVRLQPTFKKIFHLVKSPKYYYEEFRLYNENKVLLVRGPDIGIAQTSKIIKGTPMLTKNYQKFKDFLDEQQVKDVIVGGNASLRQKELNDNFPGIDHQALMPDYVPLIPILNCSKVGDTILDPFSGMATTGKVALLFGRKYFGYELNEDHANISIQHLNDVIMQVSDDEGEIAKYIQNDFQLTRKSSIKPLVDSDDEGWDIDQDDQPQRRFVARKNRKK